MLRLNGVKKNIILAGVRSPIIKKISDDVFYVLSSCGSPCVGHYFFDRNKEDYTNELIVFDINSGCIIESDSAGKKIYAKRMFSNNRRTLINLSKIEFDILSSKMNYYSDFNEMSYFDKAGNLNLIANDYEKILLKKKIINPCGSVKK
ncbi:hypothetical protein [Acinetobacter shaoyimingii]|uniref:hypothetical protein n=1 Tax=Acinetobacter shaoyimingii TaxID=2715164 RepID=UPI001D0E2751|nr:hypothetical protein [Acinetobacter shaoyimingii]